MSGGPRKRSTVVAPLAQAQEALRVLRDAAEAASCPALFVESTAALAILDEAADFDGVHA